MAQQEEPGNKPLISLSSHLSSLLLPLGPKRSQGPGGHRALLTLPLQVSAWHRAEGTVKVGLEGPTEEGCAFHLPFASGQGLLAPFTDDEE